MVAAAEATWTGSLHQTFRLLPVNLRSRHIAPFLESDGLTQEEVLQRLPYDAARSQGAVAGATPDPKRYRDGKQVYQTVGLLYESDDGRVRVTELGQATRRWLPLLNAKNSVILARHAAYALAACQLRNPLGGGSKYAGSMVVFPFKFIWQAMLALEGRISSDELNRTIFRVRNENDLAQAIANIKQYRSTQNIAILGEEVVTGPANNDRIIPWMSLASFGWTLFPDKRGAQSGEFYEIGSIGYSLIREAAQIKHRHRDFATSADYVRYISDCAALPRDMR